MIGECVYDKFLAARPRTIVSPKHEAEQLRHTTTGVLKADGSVIEAGIAATTPILNTRGNSGMMCNTLGTADNGIGAV
jgi:hypothetical protein